MTPISKLRATLNHALNGKSEVVEKAIACLLAKGHILFEDMPGLGKTTLAKAIASALGGNFARVQCTPDLLPGDITGFSIFNQKTREFEFQAGPVFADVLLADEINRATPRTQSALLEAMAERQVTVDNRRHKLTDCFFVLATQNPVEQHGTYPLPEAQLDRFAMKLSIGYPDQNAELTMLQSAFGQIEGHEKKTSPAIDVKELMSLQEQVASIVVSPSLQSYLIELAGRTRSHAKIKLGVSPRGLLIWQRVSQAWAYLQNRPFVTPDDIREVALPVLLVRLGIDTGETTRIVEELFKTVPVPV